MWFRWVFLIFILFSGFSGVAWPADTKIQRSEILHGALRKVKHNLTYSQIQLLIRLAIEGKPEEGWKKLAQFGDHYADDAYDVISHPRRFPGAFFYNLIQSNWINSAGIEAYHRSFKSFAIQHFRQYVTVLSMGYWPDAQQICLSYRKAAEDHKVPVSVVMDGLLTESGLNQLVSWQNIIGLESNRKKGCNHVFDDIPMPTAIKRLAQDVFQAVSQTFSSQTQQQPSE